MPSLDYQAKNRRRPVKETLRVETQKTVRALLITLSIMIVVLLSGFLALTSAKAQKGYTLEQLKQLNEALKSQNASIKAQIINSVSVNNFQQTETVEEMQEIQTKTYVTEEDNEVN